MVGRILFSMLVVSSCAFGQTEDYIQPGLLSSSATISPSKMLANTHGNFYVSGFAEYFLDKKLSFRGDTYLFATGKDDLPFFDEALRSYFGIFYHWNRNNFDINLGFQPGISYLKRNPYAGGIETFAPVEDERAQIMPSVSLTFGATYYVWKYFNFFANVSYVRSDLHGSPNGVYNTDELIFSAGLGFNIQTRRRE